MAGHSPGQVLFGGVVWGAIEIFGSLSHLRREGLTPTEDPLPKPSHLRRFDGTFYCQGCQVLKRNDIEFPSSTFSLEQAGHTHGDLTRYQSINFINATIVCEKINVHIHTIPKAFQ